MILLAFLDSLGFGFSLIVTLIVSLVSLQVNKNSHT